MQRERERKRERDWTLMPDVFMCIYMLVIGEGREGETKREREVYIYKYRENIKTKRDIQKKRETRTHAPDTK